MTPAAYIFSQTLSFISEFFLTIISPVIGFLMSLAVTLPKALSERLTITFPPSIISDNFIDPGFSQCFFVIVKSWATSHSLLVK